MTTQMLTSQSKSSPSHFPHFPGTRTASIRKLEAFKKDNHSLDVFAWTHLSDRVPMVHMLQPDFYMVYKLSNPGVPVYQHNLSLELGLPEPKYEAIHARMEKSDLLHLQRIDRVIHPFTLECRFRPFDFICTVMVKWNSPTAGSRYFVRKSTVLECDDQGIPCYGIIAYKDVTTMVSAIKPNNVDITFQADKDNLCFELANRIKTVQPKRTGITTREREILCCLSRGMSSKEIAAALFISKATVDTHRQNMIHKWDVSNTAALLQRVIGEGCL